MAVFWRETQISKPLCWMAIIGSHNGLPGKPSLVPRPVGHALATSATPCNRVQRMATPG